MLLNNKCISAISMQFEVSFQNPNSDKRFELLQFKIKSEMQLRCYGDFKKKIKIQRDGAAPPELCRPRRGFGIGRLPNPLAGVFGRLPKVSAGCQLALEAEKTGFCDAPEEAKMAEEPSCEHLEVTPLHLQLWR